MARQTTPPSVPDYWYVVVPTMTELFAGVTAVPVLHSPFGPVAYYLLPFWIGLLCVPGYLTAWFTLRRNCSLDRAQRSFVIGSLGVALLCALAGAVFSAFTIVGGVLSVWSGLLTVGLLRRILKASPKTATPNIVEAPDGSPQTGEASAESEFVVYQGRRP